MTDGRELAFADAIEQYIKAERTILRLKRHLIFSNLIAIVTIVMLILLQIGG